MWRKFIPAALAAALWLSGGSPAASAAPYVKTELPPDIDACFQRSLTGMFDISRSNEKALFDYFLSNIAVEQFGRYNFKRAWQDWSGNDEIRRLALYQYFELMAKKRAEHGGGTAGIEARLADNPAVDGDNVYHIVARVNFEGGSSASIVVLAAGCKAFGFMYGGTDLRALVDPNLVERLYAQGVRAP